MINPIARKLRHERLTKCIKEYLINKSVDKNLEAAVTLGYVDSAGNVTDKGYVDIKHLAVSNYKSKGYVKHNPLLKLFKG